MLSPQLRKKVFNLWTTFWSSGMTNPLVAIEQITYLLFLKQLESLDAQRMAEGKPSIYGPRRDCNLPHPETAGTKKGEPCPGHEFCQWSEIVKDPTHTLLHQYVFPWLRKLDDTFVLFSNDGNEESAPLGRGIMEDAYFQFPRDKAQTLKNAVIAIDELFPNMKLQGDDLMGDIFEYLLSEIQSSGKNGQFRTPRHLIRFMVELLDPQPGERVIDPAAGTGGFLFSTIQHLLKQETPTDMLRLEADGTPHRLRRNAEIAPYLSGEYFTGYDNDRTMVRIGWMNLILHGVENPHISRLDSLGKSFPDSESNKYHIVLANPPFTGTVDEGDLHPTRFPRKSPNSSDPITTKSELLFVWLMLDLLKLPEGDEAGGRAAVIVPEGVLFGSTNAHKELRRQLLFEHKLQAVISLPPGIFQPYTGVKTAILLFEKVGKPAEPGQAPCTDHVWFYEVLADGYTLDAKRNPQPDPNDFWDALVKYPQQVVESKDYYQPDLYTERWRVVDDATVEIFGDSVKSEIGQVRGIHELFEELSANPENAEAYVVEHQTPLIEDLYRRCASAHLMTAIQSNLLPLKKEKVEEEKVQPIVEAAVNEVHKAFNAARLLLDTEFEQFGYNTLKPCLKQIEEAVHADWESLLAQAQQTVEQNAATEEALIPDNQEWRPIADAITHEFAKLDGFEVDLRSLEVRQREEPLEESRSWMAPVRAYVRDDAWGDIGTHDEEGNVRQEYIAVLRKQGAFEADGTLTPTHLDKLDPDCIEANDFNLSAGRYKPFVLDTQKYDPPAEILRAVQKLEQELLEGIGDLLEMVESNG